MLKELKPLVINAPATGISLSPHIGNADCRNLDIYTVPGIARLNKILVKKSSTTITKTVKWIVKNPAYPSNIYALDGDGQTYYSANSGDTWAVLSDRGGYGQGLAVWKGYLFVACTTSLDVYACQNTEDGSGAWTTGWQTIDSNTSWQPMMVSKLDGKLYGGAGRYIFSVAENSGQNFAPGTSATYTWTQQHLVLPEDYQVKCLAEQNNNLMIGTWVGANIYDNMIADIFPWDGSSTTYNTPIQINERGVNAMINIGGYLYILAGTDGKIYKSNGIQAWEIAKIPEHIITLADKFLDFYPGSIMNHKGRLFFGVTKGSVSLTGIGIYSLVETNQGNYINFEHFISTGTTSGSNALGATALLGISNSQFLVGWVDNTAYGIDLLSITSYAYSVNYSGYFESKLHQVGNYENPRQFTKLEFTLAKELAVDEGIQIKFRVNLTDDFTTIGTYTISNIGSGRVSFVDKSLNVPACEMIQIRIELLGTSTTTPEFRLLSLI